MLGWAWLFVMADVRHVVVSKGEDGGFGVACNSRNIVTRLMGRAASDGALKVGEEVVSVDGDALNGDKLIDRIRSKPDATSFTLGLLMVEEEQPLPSLNQMMKSMMASPAFKKMATKMVVGMATGTGAGKMLASGEQQARLSGSMPPSLSQQQQSQQQLATAQHQLEQQQQQQQQLNEHLERQVGALLDSDAFSSMIDKVVDSPAIQKVVRSAEDGTLCPDAESAEAVTACLLDGTLLRDVADATCKAAGVDASECDRVHAMTKAMLSRLGLRGDGWMGWFARRVMLRPWLMNVLEGGAACLMAAATAVLLRRWLRRQRSSHQAAAVGASPTRSIRPHCGKED